MPRQKNHSENWGGAREGAGRPTKGETLKVRELLDDHIDPSLVIQKLLERIESGDHRAIELYMKYRAGVPKQEIDIHQTGNTDVSLTLRDIVSFKE